jgi:hypothetical protein
MLNQYKDSPEEFTKITNIENLNTELNISNQMLKYSPLIAILVNGSFNMIKVIFDHIMVQRSIKIDLNQKDPRNRNIMHCLIYNKKISDEERLYIFENFLMRINQDMTFSADKSSVKPLCNEIDKDGFLPVALYIGKVKHDSQDEDSHLRMFDLLSENTDFDTVLTDLKHDSFMHPLVMCIKSKLDKYFNKLLTLSSMLKKQIVYMEQDSKRSTIEYAFDSQMEAFIRPILNSMDRIDSFILYSSKDICITLFDVFFSVVKNARTVDELVLNKDELEPSHPIVEWIQKLSDIIFTQTKDSKNNRAEDF